jgi:hypothetical protein
MINRSPEDGEGAPEILLIFPEKGQTKP